MVNKTQLIELAIRPTLKKLNLWSPEAETLLAMIAAHESNCGQYIAQIRGPARGVFQMEPATHDDIHKWLKATRPELYQLLHTATGTTRESMVADTMMTDLDYAIAMGRIFFLRISAPIPKTLPEMAVYAKRYWNTYLGKATAEDYLKAYSNWKS